MKEIERNIMFAKAGGNASKNAYTCRISLPMDAIKALGVTPEDRAVRINSGALLTQKKRRIFCAYRVQIIVE